MRRTTAWCLLAVALLGGCSSAVAGRGSRLPHPPPAGQVVFRVSAEVGGFAPAAFYWTARPALTVYGDGSAYLARAQPTRLRAPWTFQRGTVPIATLRELISDAESSGLFDGADFGEPRITDVGTTSIAFRPGRGPEREASAYALGIGADAERELSRLQRDNRDALRRIEHRLFDAVTGERDWAPTHVDVTLPALPDADSSPAPPWPGPATATLLTRITRHGRCGDASGSAASALFRAAVRNSEGHWVTGGRTVVLLVRGLLPGEAACPH